VERWAEQVAAEAGFTAVDHTVELFGLCPQCSLEKPRSQEEPRSPGKPRREGAAGP
jgi:Fur family ferric uptake transcriptional regulator